MEDFYNQTVKETREDTQKTERAVTANVLFKEGGFSLEKIAEISGLPLDEMKKLQEERTRDVQSGCWLS